MKGQLIFMQAIPPGVFASGRQAAGFHGAVKLRKGQSPHVLIRRKGALRE